MTLSTAEIIGITVVSIALGAATVIICLRCCNSMAVLAEESNNASRAKRAKLLARNISNNVRASFRRVRDSFRVKDRRRRPQSTSNKVVPTVSEKTKISNSDVHPVYLKDKEEGDKGRPMSEQTQKNKPMPSKDVLEMPGSKLSPKRDLPDCKKDGGSWSLPDNPLQGRPSIAIAAPGRSPTPPPTVPLPPPLQPPPSYLAHLKKTQFVKHYGYPEKTPEHKYELRERQKAQPESNASESQGSQHHQGSSRQEALWSGPDAASPVPQKEAPGVNQPIYLTDESEQRFVNGKNHDRRHHLKSPHENDLLEYRNNHSSHVTERQSPRYLSGYENQPILQPLSIPFEQSHPSEHYDEFADIHKNHAPLEPFRPSYHHDNPQSDGPEATHLANLYYPREILEGTARIGAHRDMYPNERFPYEHTHGGDLQGYGTWQNSPPNLEYESRHPVQYPYPGNPGYQLPEERRVWPSGQSKDYHQQNPQRGQVPYHDPYRGRPQYPSYGYVPPRDGERHHRARERSNRGHPRRNEDRWPHSQHQPPRGYVRQDKPATRGHKEHRSLRPMQLRVHTEPYYQNHGKEPPWRYGDTDPVSYKSYDVRKQSHSTDTYV